MGKRSFKFRQWWSDLFSFLRLRRFEGVITNASAEDIAEDMAKSSFKSPEEALEFLKADCQKSREQYECRQQQKRIQKLSEIEVGMIWYEDDTFSFERIKDKKIKAVVELIRSGIIYGDLTASELQDIQEQELDWYEAEKYFKNFSYPCKGNEKIVWYTRDQLLKVSETYKHVRKTFKKIGKKWRKNYFWSCSEFLREYADIVMVHNFCSSIREKDRRSYIRPVLALSLYEDQTIECIPMTCANLSKIQVGMIWYEDNTASFKRTFGKKVKAIVELIDGNEIYGDLTVSELQDIQVQELNWYAAKRYFENFSYPCEENERIVWYSVEQLEEVYGSYDIVRKTFEILCERCRINWFWSSTEAPGRSAWGVNGAKDEGIESSKTNVHCVRPAIVFRVS